MTRFSIDIDKIVPEGFTLPQEAIDELCACRQRLAALRNAEASLDKTDSELRALDPAQQQPPEDINAIANMIGDRNRLWWSIIVLTARTAKQIETFADAAIERGGWFWKAYDAATAKVRQRRDYLEERYPSEKGYRDRSLVERGDGEIKKLCDSADKLNLIGNDLRRTRESAAKVYAAAREAFHRELRAKLVEPSEAPPAVTPTASFRSLTYPAA